MKIKLLTALLVGTTLAFAPAAMAEPGEAGHENTWEQMKNMTPAEREAKRNEMRAKWNGMSSEEKEQFKAERKAKWDALSKEEKVRMIEDRRAMKRKEMDEHWNSMSDDEKISHTEEKMRRNHDGPCLHGDDDEGRPARRGPRQQRQAPPAGE